MYLNPTKNVRDLRGCLYAVVDTWEMFDAPDILLVNPLDRTGSIVMFVVVVCHGAHRRLNITWWCLYICSVTPSLL